MQLLKGVIIVVQNSPLMKKQLTLFLIAALMVGCEDGTELTSVKNGLYAGFFYYQGIHYYSSVSIDNSSYTEGASGGVIFIC